MEKALSKLAELKNYIFKVQQLSDSPEIAYTWGNDPFYVAHRNIALELMHKGHRDDAIKLLENYVSYQYHDRLGEANADLSNIWDGLIPLTRDNIERLYKQHNGIMVATDIYFPLPYVNYTFLNVLQEERSKLMEDEHNTVLPLEWILDGERELDNAFLDVYNTKLNNASYPFLKIC
ncbi:hypothetical protein [Sphingobacterium paludis]|uniref:Uncharacterized protein n=1 Tax=Sphingobacterium paludis TaxID=1476465 RepID=A0A4R7CRT9_9SPHI|nr:hypothetical protein [Sphingobacterium paludis]TDS06570.1 hypothetical protein B0I21_11610 [Sphingobacterium paludis]